MNFPKHVFRAYDIRGIATGEDAEITPDFARSLGKAFINELGIEKPKIVVGRDNRLSGSKLSEALIAGLVEAGGEVLDIGHATSPYLYFVVCNQDFDGGIEITASHNPPDYNGFKIVGKDALPFTESQLQNLSEKISQEFPILEGKVDAANFREEYFKKLISLSPIKRKLKIVVDCGNGTAGYFSTDFFTQLGCEVVELYCKPDGNFPNHMPNPEEASSLVDLQELVKNEKADLGIAFDGDGDRVGIVSEFGEIISPDRLIVLLSRDLLSRNPNAQVVFDVKCSDVLPAEILKSGGKPLRWKTGHSFIKRKMKEEKALLAGEVSGHLFFGEDYYGVDDGMLAAAKIISIVSNSDKTITELLSDIPTTFTTPEIKLPIADEVKFDVLKKIVAEFSEKFSNANTLDGVRVSFSDGSWGLIRASNTSPCFTARFEALSEERLLNLIVEFAELLKKYPEVDIGKL
jgi:phosphomannomutase/phosphoglucomutase